MKILVQFADFLGKKILFLFRIQMKIVSL